MTIRTKSSPCVGFCSTTYGDDICRGCFRQLDEVLNWRQKSSQDKQLYYPRLSRQVKSVMEIYWSLGSPDELAVKILQDYEIFAPPEGPPCAYFSLFQLLQHGINPISSYASYIKWNTHDMSLHELSRLVSRSVYVANENAL